MKKNRLNLVAGTALSLVISQTAFAGTSAFQQGEQTARNAALQLAQADPCPEGQTRTDDGTCVVVETDAAVEAEVPAAEAVEEAAPEAPESEPAPAEEPASEEPAAEEPAAEEPAAEEPAAEESAPAEEPAAEEPAEAQAEPEAAEPEQPAANEEEPAAEEEAAPEAEAEADVNADVEAETPAADAEVETEAEAEAEAAPETEPAASEQPADDAEAVPAEADNTTATDEPAAEEPAMEGDAATSAEEEPASEEEAVAPSDEESATEQAAEEEAPEEAVAEGEAEQPQAAPMDGEEASLTDSGKEAGVSAEEEARAGDEESAESETQATVVTEENIPDSDAAAQADAVPEEIEPVDTEEGQQLSGEAADRAVRSRPQDREGSRVVGRFGNREVVQLATGALVVATVAAIAANAGNDNRDRDRRDYVPRLRRGAERTTVEELRGGRYRETVERPNGVRIVTIYNDYGEVLRRTRVSRDGNERTLVYVPRDRWDSLRDPAYDPGADLPPLVVRIPRDQYIFDVEEPVSDDRYYDFLAQPPVERVERLYSVSEVRNSARIRDKVRRIDLGTVNFEFGRASISDSEVDELQSLANAMERLLDRNPAETFLIEGHTDAVGSDPANLALSDARAESVASALTNVFGIPPENLETQGYGERYLKVRTEEPSVENRRVAVRRITPLVSPENVARAD